MATSTVPQISIEQMRWFRLRRSGLVKPYATPVAAARALMGVQAQILPAAALALWNRTPRLTYAGFEDLLYRRRSLVKLWGQRHTLHVYDSRDWPLLHAARSVNRTWWERQAENGDYAFQNYTLEDYRRLVEQVAELLRTRKTMGRSDLRTSGLDVPEELYNAWGGIFADLVRQGYACHAGRVGNEGHFAHRERWLPKLAWDPPAPAEANRAMAARYFAAYGPSTTRDFLYWRAINRGDAQASLDALASDLAEVRVDGAPMHVLRAGLATLRRRPPDAEAWPVRLLYRFDPYLLAHRDKGWVVDPAHYNAVWRPAGHIEGIVLAHGRGLGTWRYDRKGKGLAIQVTPFAPLPAYVAQQIPALAEQVAAFFGLPLSDLQIGQ
ncbi:MAG: winged helix DNA-binding domain-containing protein [Chloroflexi bacterium]|nr:MAG: winged helix DNA-binding domain-containing protein [Chloroflexota bacterium]